ncbi:hypothetical protein FRC03_001105 [Tulasnella sp. 419]|nr:hypothetical protein FRC03_001105 [Tulasnella sp. 419]
MTITEVTRLRQYNEIINDDGYSIFLFWATWCGPCRMISPVFETLAGKSEYASVKFYKADVDAASEVAQAAEIRVMPTFVLFRDGKRVGSVSGANPLSLEGLLAKADSESF